MYENFYKEINSKTTSNIFQHYTKTINLLLCFLKIQEPPNKSFMLQYIGSNSNFTKKYSRKEVVHSLLQRHNFGLEANATVFFSFYSH